MLIPIYGPLKQFNYNKTLTHISQIFYSNQIVIIWCPSVKPHQESLKGTLIMIQFFSCVDIYMYVFKFRFMRDLKKKAFKVYITNNLACLYPDKILNTLFASFNFDHTFYILVTWQIAAQSSIICLSSRAAHPPKFLIEGLSNYCWLYLIQLSEREKGTDRTLLKAAADLHDCIVKRLSNKQIAL